MEDFFRFGLRNVDGDQYGLFEMMTAEWVRVISTFTNGDPARDIAIGPDGFIWLLKKTPGTSHLPDDGVDFELHRYNGFGMYHRSGWDRVPGEGVAVTVDHEGQPWLVQASGTIVRRTGSGWQRLPGSATDISAGADGTVWAVGSRELPGGHEEIPAMGGAGLARGARCGAEDRGVAIGRAPGSATTVTRSSGGSGGRWYRVPTGALSTSPSEPTGTAGSSGMTVVGRAGTVATAGMAAIGTGPMVPVSGLPSRRMEYLG